MAAFHQRPTGERVQCALVVKNIAPGFLALQAGSFSAGIGPEVFPSGSDCSNSPKPLTSSNHKTQN
ncbi:Uncharacterized protein DAT39_003129 [Clarias magur]|uniref:Uncharacterized protein n=1 Tax=Clarias magur TaxID=1594786 RepID=A0A8J4UUV9_CLAMG|nr:Uncharacterized protein DAT39_003129 [Clarias magur]